MTVNPLPYAQVIDEKMDEMRADEDTAAMLEGQDIPKLMSYTTIAVDMNNTNESSDVNVTISPAIIDEMQNSDVTTIAGVCKEMTSDVFDQLKPQLIQKASDGMTSGITAMEDGAAEMQDGLNKMESGRSELMGAQVNLQSAYDDLSETIAEMKAARDAIPAMFDEAETNYLTAVDNCASEIQATYQQTLNSGFKGMAIFVAICALVGLALLLPYHENRKEYAEQEEHETANATVAA